MNPKVITSDAMFVRLLIGGLPLILCSAASAQSLKLDTSISASLLLTATTTEYQKTKGTASANPGAASSYSSVAAAPSMTVEKSGTGAALRKFCRGETDIVASDRPILVQELAACSSRGVNFVEVPVAFDALTVIVNPRNTAVKSLSIDDLRKLWEPSAQGNIEKWKQVNPALPDTFVKILSPGPDSGSFEYFTQAVTGEAKYARKDYMQSDDEAVLVQGVARDPAAVSFVGYSFYAKNASRVSAVAISEKAGGAAVAPSESTVQSGAYRPFSHPILLYVNAKSLDREDVQGFVSFLLANGPRLVRDVKLIPLATADYTRAQDAIAKRRVGTAFGGKIETGLRVTDMAAREPRS